MKPDDYIFLARTDIDDEQAYRMFAGWGWRVSWVPWWKRAWWSLRRLWRRP